MALVSRSTAGATKVTEDNAKRSIERFRNQGYTMLNPDNNDHVQAFLQLRAMGASIHGRTLRDFLNNRQSNVNVGRQMEVDYWAVPKNNFPGGLPDRYKDSEINDGE